MPTASLRDTGTVMPIDWNDHDIRERARKAAMRGVIRATEAVRNEAISLILNSPKTGRVYRRGGVEHIASAPGEPPASDTGRLVNSIETVYDVLQLSGIVRCTVAYGPFLEYGTQKMEPRPFLRPAVANTRREVQAIVQEEIEREFK